MYQLKFIARTTAVVLCACPLLAFSQVPRTDVLECGLPGGGKFRLVSRYVSIPFNLNPRSNKTREPNGPFKVFFSESGHRSVPLDMVMSGETLTPVERDARMMQAKRLCLSFGRFEGSVFANGFVRAPGEKKFLEVRLPQDRLFPASTGRFTEKQIRRLAEDGVTFLTPELKQDIESLGAFPFPLHRVFAILSKDVRVSESALATKDEGEERQKIVAVWQTISNDGGATWSKPVLTRDAKVYTIGRTLYEQCFIARPIAINGVKVDLAFPSCEGG